MSWLPEIARWYAVLLAMTLAWAPWVRLLCAALPDRGATLGKPLALLATVYPVWLLAFGPLPYSGTALWTVVALAGISGWVVVARRRLLDRDWTIRIATSEGVTLAVLLAALWLRGFTPDIAGTEKPMDIALLAATQRAEEMPPPDPWFAGEHINYYYLGYLLHGSLGRMAAVPPAVAFNLALATTIALTVTAAAGLAYNATRRWVAPRRALAAAALGAFLLPFAGNLLAPQRFLEAPDWHLDGGYWAWWDPTNGIGWQASRVICDGEREANRDCPSAFENIDEFPFFSFLLGDLHPHVTALPFTLVALGLALTLALRDWGDRPLTERRAWRDHLTLLAAGAMIGGLYALNSWDFPTFLLVTLLALWAGLRGRAWRDVVVGAAALIVASLLAWLPFYLTFTAPVGSGASDVPAWLRDLPLVARIVETLAAHTGERTSAGEFLTMWGVPYVAACWLIATGFVRSDRLGEDGAVRGAGLGSYLPIAAILVLAALLLPAPVLLLAGLPLLGATVLLSRETRITPRTLATGLFAVGFTLLIGAEFFYIQDLFGRRMNTIFKVYYQVWTLFAIGTALAVVVLWREVRPRAYARPAIAGFVTLAVLAGLVYPVVASYQWTDHFADWRTLDGMAYIEEGAPDEAAAIAWLRANAGPGDVVLEAAGCSYDSVGGVPHNRASAFTGVPAIVGWGWHETQWRNGSPQAREIGSRQADVRVLFADPSGALLDRYGVTYLYVGAVERLASGDCPSSGPYEGVSSPDFPGAGWQEVFRSGEVAIYRRLPTATAASPGG